jgi:hypothetical protein
LDNVYVLSENPEAFALAKRYCVSQKDTVGLILNEGKCKEHDLWHVKMGTASIEMLGACIGTKHARQMFLENKIAEVEKILGRLKQLPGQAAQYLMRHSTSNKLRHLLRAMELQDLHETLATLDSLHYGVIDSIRGIHHANEKGIHDREIMSLPCKLGGLGIISHEDTQPFARKASLAVSRGELIQRGVSSVRDLIELAIIKESEGMTNEQNPYRQDGPLPLVED